MAALTERPPKRDSAAALVLLEVAKNFAQVMMAGALDERVARDRHVLAEERGQAGEVYNFGGRTELTNLELTQRLLHETGRDEDAIEYVTDRLGHDLRYAIDCTKAERDLAWRPQVPFEQGLRDTIDSLALPPLGEGGKLEIQYSFRFDPPP